MVMNEVKRVALVTGASRGIGRAVADRLAREGRHVVLVSRARAPLDDAVAAIRSRGNSASAISCDVGDPAALTEAIGETVRSLGRLDILVNNAGITRDGLMLRMSDEDFDEVIRVNLKSAFVACRAAARPMMGNRWGRIVNVSSISGRIGRAAQVNYCAAKAGLIGMTKAIAKEFATKGITANVVAPGFIETDMTADLPEAIKEEAKNITPMRRFGQADEIAAAVAYFTSEEAGFVTGEVLAVAGGMGM